MLLLSGSSNPTLAQAIARELDISQVAIEISHFANGEKRVWIQDSVQGQNVVLVQSFSAPTDEYIMETLLIVDALERQGVRHVNLVIPWMGYSLQDKVFRPGEPIAAKVVANLISHAHIKRAILFDLHNSSTPGFFSIPSHHVTAHQLFAEFVTTTIGLDNAVIASPDFGGLKRSRVFATALGLELVNIDKHRDLSTGEVSAMGMSGEVEGKKVLLYDDVIISGNTVAETAKLLVNEGASEVYFLSTHGVFTPGALEKLSASPLNQVVITNSISHEHLPEKIIQLDAAQLFADELRAWI
jgi:ribose-phosphate pyrophosphokinase